MKAKREYQHKGYEHVVPAAPGVRAVFIRKTIEEDGDSSFDVVTAPVFAWAFVVSDSPSGELKAWEPIVSHTDEWPCATHAGDRDELGMAWKCTLFPGDSIISWDEYGNPIVKRMRDESIAPYTPPKPKAGSK